MDALFGMAALLSVVAAIVGARHARTDALRGFFWQFRLASYDAAGRRWMRIAFVFAFVALIAWLAV